MIGIIDGSYRIEKENKKLQFESLLNLIVAVVPMTGGSDR
jgi:hypothetical protein